VKRLRIWLLILRHRIAPYLDGEIKRLRQENAWHRRARQETYDRAKDSSHRLEIHRLNTALAKANKRLRIQHATLSTYRRAQVHEMDVLHEMENELSRVRTQLAAVTSERDTERELKEIWLSSYTSAMERIRKLKE